MLAGIFCYGLHEAHIVLPALFEIEDALRLSLLVGRLDPHWVALCSAGVSQERLSWVHISLHILVEVLHHVLG